jgi:hypothetical protein
MFFVPQMALAYRLDAISQGPKIFRIPGPNPLPLALVMDAHIQNIMHGAVCIDHRCINSYSSIEQNRKEICPYYCVPATERITYKLISFYHLLSFASYNAKLYSRGTVVQTGFYFP